jgi:uncharacterized membrane protein YfcA
VVLALAGLAAGVVAGLFGVGGGILFVPALVAFASLGQLEAQATSLLAVIPVSLVGAVQQHRYGNLRLRDALTLGALATLGGFAGVALANVVPERALQYAFAGLLVFTAIQMARRALRPADD